jgi:hypothetical protein
MHVLDDHGKQVVFMDSESIAEEANALLEGVAYRAHVLLLQRRSKVEVPVSTAICTTVCQRVHIDVKVLDDENARIRVGVLNVNDVLRRRVSGYDRAVPCRF